MSVADGINHSLHTQRQHPESKLLILGTHTCLPMDKTVMPRIKNHTKVGFEPLFEGIESQSIIGRIHIPTGYGPRFKVIEKQYICIYVGPVYRALIGSEPHFEGIDHQSQGLPWPSTRCNVLQKETHWKVDYSHQLTCVFEVAAAV